jgi:N-methylhydantoinase A
MTITYSADLRYEAQLNEIEVSIPLDNGIFTMRELPRLQQAFDNKHDALYGYNLPGTNLELVCLRVKAVGLTEKPKFREMPYMGEDASPAVKGQRKIYYGDTFITVPVYDGRKMGYGHKVSGPAIIEEPTTTIFVTPDFHSTCDTYGNYLLHPKDISLEEVIGRLKK